MTKRFCDLCGKEIHNLQETYRVCVESNASIYASNPDIVDVIFAGANWRAENG